MAGRFEPAHELGGDLHDFLDPEAEQARRRRRRRVRQRSAGGAVRRLCAELVRSRTLRRRYTPDEFSVAGVLQAMNTILHERQLEEYYCTLCYAFFDFKRAHGDALELRVCRIRCDARMTSAGRSSSPGCRSDRFPA